MYRSLYVLLVLFYISSPAFCENNLYKLLGVTRDASISEIKRAYRRKALDTHPDKNPNQEQAAEEFRKVVDAFEILSNTETRRRYDQTGRTTQSSNSNTRWQYQHTWQWRQPRSLKDHPKVKEAKLRVLHVVSMTQLETIMLDVEGVLERHLLLCFYTPTSESIAENTLLFPYPFAGMSAQGIWWEDLLQTVVVRHHTMNHELAQHFGVTSSDSVPTLVFLNKGDTLEEYTTFQTTNRVDFENFMWQRLEVNIKFVNNHSHPVELYWVDGTRANLRKTIAPHRSHGERTMLSHEYVARDARVDAFEGSPGRYKLTPNVLLASWKIKSTDVTEFVIETKPCIDLSGHCGYWAVNPKGECERNPGFMHEKCPLTCKVCDEAANNETASDAHDEL